MGFSEGFRLSMQRALWGMITPSIRAIALSWVGDVGHARFIFDDVPGVDEFELVAEVETEVIADFAEDARFDFTATSVPTGPLIFESGEQWWAFVRREE